MLVVCVFVCVACYVCVCWCCLLVCVFTISLSGTLQLLLCKHWDFIGCHHAACCHLAAIVTDIDDLNLCVWSFGMQRNIQPLDELA